ncbi:hypothetical protein DVH05_010968 [Phytophthora capsici]|nr:hypothetical protein DVH05_010968 [Phytophthora capsici]
MAGVKSRRKRDVAARYLRANALVGAILNKLHNGSARAVDPFVGRTLQEHEARLLGIQCFLEQGPVENSRQFKDESHVADQISHPSGGFGLFTLCGGFFGPGTIMYVLFAGK